MPNNLKVGDKFPDFQLPNHNGKLVSPSKFTTPSLIDQRLGFPDGYPLIVMFNRGFFCPRDQQQMKLLVPFQDELRVNFGKLISISVDPPKVQAAFRAGLGANWTFVSDEERKLVRQLDILDETEGEYAYCALPYTYVLKPDLTIHKIYGGWYFVGRPTVEELRQDLRSIMLALSYYSYDAYNTEHVKKIRVPQQIWKEGAPELGASGNEVKSGHIEEFDLNSGNGMILSDDGVEYFFNFTAIPGEGYRTVRAGQKVNFEIVDTETGQVAFNIRSV